VRREVMRGSRGTPKARPLRKPPAWAKLSMRTMLVKIGTEADNQVQHGELDDGAAETVELKGGGMGSFLLESRTMRMSGDAEDRA